MIKVFKINMVLLLLVCNQLPSYAQSENDMTNHSLVLPLKTGENPSVQWETLVIAPVNLFVQTQPITDTSPHIQLELNVVEDTNSYTTFLWYYGVANGGAKTNYPKAYQNYAFDLKIDKNEVALVVKKLTFEKALFLELGQTAVIGNLTLRFEDCISEWSTDSNGDQTDAFSTYTISVSEAQEQQTLSFTSLETQGGNELALPWKSYRILVKETTEKAIKLVVSKNK